MTAYVEASLCPAAKKELAQAHGEAGDVNVRAVCLPNPREGGKLNLAIIGANARRATEDSTAVVFIGAIDPRASGFADPILETAEIPTIYTDSGSAAMDRTLAILRSAGSGSLRGELQDRLARPNGDPPLGD